MAGNERLIKALVELSEVSATLAINLNRRTKNKQ